MVVHKTFSRILPELGVSSCRFWDRPDDTTLFGAIVECWMFNWNAVDTYQNVVYGAMGNIESQDENMCQEVFAHFPQYKNDQTIEMFLIFILVLLLARLFFSCLPWFAKNDQACTMWRFLRFFVHFYIAGGICVFSITMYKYVHLLIHECCKNRFRLHLISVFTATVQILSCESVLKNGAIFLIFTRILAHFLNLGFLQDCLPLVAKFFGPEFSQLCVTLTIMFEPYKEFFDLNLQPRLTHAYIFFRCYVYDINYEINRLLAFCYETLSSVFVASDDQKMCIILAMIIFCHFVHALKKAAHHRYLLWGLNTLMQKTLELLNSLKKA